MQELAAKAIGQWTIAVQSLTLAARRENAVFHVTAGDGCSYALRLHRQDHRSDQELLGELQWMAALEAGGLRVPRPVTSANGRLIEVVDGVQCDLLTWLPGRPLGVTGAPLGLPDGAAVFARMGHAMARLHQLSDDWHLPEGFRRPSWNLPGLAGEDPVWGRFWDHPALTGAQRQILLRARDRARAEVTAATNLDFGLIHADMVRENVLVEDGEIGLIDFDDGGFGYRLFDIATALIKNRAEPDYGEMAAALLRGYRGVRPLDTALLPVFMMLRSFTYLGWIMPRRDEPGGAERSARFIASAMPLAEAYMAE